MEVIDPGKVIRRIYSGKYCSRIDAITLKDLHYVSDDLSSIVMVDNNISSFMRQLSNGIWVKSYLGDEQDAELMGLLRKLLKLKDCASIPEQLSKDYGYENLYNYFSHNW